MIDFVLTVLGGGPDSAEVITRTKTINIRKKIKQLSDRDYSTTLKKFKVTLLVEGNLTMYENRDSGTQNIRFSAKKEEISCDLLIKNEDWKELKGAEEKVDVFLNEIFIDSYMKMLDYLLKKKKEINSQLLISDLEKVLGNISD